MGNIQSDVNLLPFNTFRVSAKAKKFLVLHDPKELPVNEPILVLGDGANILFTKDFDGLVIKNELAGKKVISEDNESVTVEVSSGENWSDLVGWAVENSWSGIENMASIPGTVGAAVVGNIAAYGGNLEDICENATAFDLSSGEKQQFSKGDLKFGYRESIFTKELKNKFFLSSATLKFSKKPKYDIHYHSRYESLASYLPDHPNSPYTPEEIAEAVTKIRLDKLPDWRKIGTAGSFFKNPLVSWSKYQSLTKKVSGLQWYPAEKLIYSTHNIPDLPNSPDCLVKVPAGRLLDELGWKGKRIGHVGTWKKHALTVVNYDGATGKEILDFTNQMKDDISSHFAINLEPEVNII